MKKTISLPADLARDAERLAQSEAKSLSAVIQEALRLARAERLKREFKQVRQPVEKVHLGRPIKRCQIQGARNPEEGSVLRKYVD